MKREKNEKGQLISNPIVFALLFLVTLTGMYSCRNKNEYHFVKNKSDKVFLVSENGKDSIQLGFRPLTQVYSNYQILKTNLPANVNDYQKLILNINPDDLSNLGSINLYSMPSKSAVGPNTVDLTKFKLANVLASPTSFPVQNLVIGNNEINLLQFSDGVPPNAVLKDFDYLLLAPYSYRETIGTADYNFLGFNVTAWKTVAGKPTLVQPNTPTYNNGNPSPPKNPL